MSWYVCMFIIFLVFNVGFVCGAWLGGSTTRGSSEMEGVETQGSGLEKVSA